MRPLHVLILTPRGRGGVGGVDRLMDSLRDEAERLAPDIRLTFLTSRGRTIIESPAWVALAIVRIAAVRLMRGADVAHINLGANASTWRKALLARWCEAIGVPYVIHLHGADFADFWPRDASWRRRVIDRLFRSGAAVVVLGSAWRQLVEDRLPQLGSPLHVIPNAARAPTLAKGGEVDAEVRLLFLGELGPRKGVPTLLEALATMNADTPWRAILAGEGAITETRRAAAALGLADRVEVSGWLPPADVARRLAWADVFVLPSQSENLPLAVIEAMAAGLAVVATPVGAIGDIVHDGETGLLTPPGDAAALAAALRRVIDEPVLRRRLGEAARMFHREHLDLGPFADRLAAVWREASERGGRR